MLSEAEILQFIGEDKSSGKKRAAATGQKYYEGEHDILQYRVFYFNSDGQLVEDTTRANIRIPHPFFTELVDQEAQYILSGKDGIVKSDIPELQKRLDEYFNEDFLAELNDVLVGAVSKGFEYMYAYTNADGHLAFQCADSMGVVEVRGKDTDDGCDYVIYWYVDRVVKTNKQITRIQVWDSKNVYYYVQDDQGKLEKDNCFKPANGDARNVKPHVVYEEGGITYFENFGFIPFFRLDNCKKQWSGLKPIKSLIDDYDLMSCGLSNNLADFDNPVHVVRGFQGDNLDELQQNLKTKKLIGVDSDGDVEVRTIEIPYQARLVKMQEDEKNIYRFGMGFNSAQLGDGNVTNVVIKSRYALLDLKCNKLEIKLRQFLKRILKVVLKEINHFDGTDYRVTDVYFDLDREVMTNASDNADIKKTEAETQQIRINTILNVAQALDDETVLQSICDVLEVDYETVAERLPENQETETNGAQDKLDEVITDDEGREGSPAGTA